MDKLVDLQSKIYQQEHMNVIYENIDQFVEGYDKLSGAALENIHNKIIRESARLLNKFYNLIDYVQEHKIYKDLITQIYEICSEIMVLRFKRFEKRHGSDPNFRVEYETAKTFRQSAATCSSHFVYIEEDYFAKISEITNMMTDARIASDTDRQEKKNRNDNAKKLKLRSQELLRHKKNIPDITKASSTVLEKYLDLFALFVHSLLKVFMEHYQILYNSNDATSFIGCMPTFMEQQIQMKMQIKTLIDDARIEMNTRIPLIRLKLSDQSTL